MTSWNNKIMLRLGPSGPEHSPLSLTLVSNISGSVECVPARPFTTHWPAPSRWLMVCILLSRLCGKTQSAASEMFAVWVLGTNSRRGAVAVLSWDGLPSGDWRNINTPPLAGTDLDWRIEKVEGKKYWSHSTVVSRGGIRGMSTYKNAVLSGPCHSTALKYVTANPGPYTTIF